MSRLILETDLSVILNNARVIRESVGKDTKIISVVKADAYGHGSASIAKMLSKNALADGFAVATLNEALEIRKACADKAVIILGYTDKEEMKEAVEYGISPAVYSAEMLSDLSQCAKNAGKKAKAHLKIDTGMNRIGVKGKKKISEILDTWKDCGNVEMEGLFSHFSSADSDEEFTLLQFAEFQNAVKQVKDSGFKPMTHIAASSAMTDERFQMDAVREGIALYGVGYGNLIGKVDFAQKLYTHPVRIECIKAGESVGYSRNYRAKEDITIMTIPCGYADGYPRILSGKAEVLVNGRRAPIIGNICMDMMMADITGIENVTLESEVVLMGRQGVDRITPSELASLAGTIPYEIMLGFMARAERRQV